MSEPVMLENINTGVVATAATWEKGGFTLEDGLREVVEDELFHWVPVEVEAVEGLGITLESNHTLNDYEKVVNCINSCKTKEHFEVAQKLCINYCKTYPTMFGNKARLICALETALRDQCFRLDYTRSLESFKAKVCSTMNKDLGLYSQMATNMNCEVNEHV